MRWGTVTYNGANQMSRLSIGLAVITSSLLLGGCTVTVHHAPPSGHQAESRAMKQHTEQHSTHTAQPQEAPQRSTSQGEAVPIRPGMRSLPGIQLGTDEEQTQAAPPPGMPGIPARPSDRREPVANVPPERADTSHRDRTPPRATPAQPGRGSGQATIPAQPSERAEAPAQDRSPPRATPAQPAERTDPPGRSGSAPRATPAIPGHGPDQTTQPAEPSERAQGRGPHHDEEEELNGEEDQRPGRGLGRR